MATFSWSDNFKIAFRSCSSCLWPLHDSDDSLRPDQPNGPINRPSQARSDELQGLLANADTDVEAERMSLHSNPGRGSPSQRKKKNARRRSRKTSTDSNPRRITLFGFNLFGRPPPPPIQLADDSEDALYSRRGTTTPNTHSTTSSTFDSDAAPLDTDTIAALSSPTTAAAAIEAAVQASAELEAQRLKEKEERRRKRKERKELKRMAEHLAQQGIVGDGEEFEGFQGSGSGNLAFTQSPHSRIPSGILPGSDSGSGHREQPSLVSAPPREEQDDNDDTADLDGSHYAPSGSNGGSDSRSRTSTTLSDRMHLPSENAPLSAAVAKPRLKNSKDKGSSSRTTKSSSSNTSQSPSLRQMVSPSTIEQGQGFFDVEDDGPPVKKPDTGYLPITGFGGTPVTSRMASNLGAILAQRGGNDASGD